jgi:pantothenate kinase
VVLVEGNYVLLGIEPWSALITEGLFDDTWFVDVDLDVAMGRVFERQTGHGVAPDVSRRRIATNDRPNGELVNEQSRARAAVLVPSSIPFAAAAAASATESERNSSV